MKPILVFYAGLLYGEYDQYPPAREMPDGAYLYCHKLDTWYVAMHRGWTPINLSDVPKELRTYLLLLT